MVLTIEFEREADGRWKATASGIANGSVWGAETQGKALHALAYRLDFSPPTPSPSEGDAE